MLDNLMEVKCIDGISMSHIDAKWLTVCVFEYYEQSM